MTLTKQDIREQAKRYRESIRPNLDDAEKACRLFFESCAPRKDQIIALYWPKKDEFSTQLILEQLLEEGFTCCLPITSKDQRALKFAKWEKDAPLREGAYKIHEPMVNEKTEWLEPDIVVVPLIAFDRKGHRLGYGAGHYDATLDDLRQKKDVLSVGIAFAEQLVLFPLPAEDHDQPLDLVITPERVYSFLS